jgi:hypothetical protein
VWLSSATASGNQSPAESVGQASARGRANEGGSRPYDPCNQSAARAHSVGRSKGVPHATLPRSPRSHAPRKKTHGPAGGNSGQLFRRRRHPTGHCAISPTYTAVPCSTIEKFADCPGSDPGKEIGAVPRCWTAAESGPWILRVVADPWISKNIEPGPRGQGVIRFPADSIDLGHS